MIGGILLQKTCNAYPEQYDAVQNGECVGYLSMRHSRFTVESPDIGGALLYEVENLDGDGEFDDDERDFYLKLAIDAIYLHIARTPFDHLVREAAYRASIGEKEMARMHMFVAMAALDRD